MKNNFILTITGLFLATAMTTSVNAMELSAKGVKAGLNMGSFSGADSDISGVEKKSRMGLAVGGFIKMDLGNNLMLRPEVMFIQKGVTFDAGTFGKTENNLNYIDIPVMIEYGVAKGNMPIHVFGGVNIAMLLSAESKDDTGTTDVKSDTTSLDYGLQFGAGTIINKNIAVDLRYAMGLAKVDSTGSVDMKNSGILLTGGYLF